MLAEWAVLESERPRLRPLTVADLDVWHRALFSDPEVTRYLPVRRPVSRARAAVRLRRFLETWERTASGCGR
jgi:RimJ/RimL family protein N-acetyltransferase